MRYSWLTTIEKRVRGKKNNIVESDEKEQYGLVRRKRTIGYEYCRYQ